MARKNRRPAKKAAKKTAEQRAVENFIARLHPAARSAIKWAERREALSARESQIDAEISRLEAMKRALRAEVTGRQEAREAVREVGVQKIAYDVHFVPAYKVKSALKEMESSRVEACDSFSEVVDEIEKLKEEKKKVKDKKTFADAVLRSHTPMFVDRL